MIHAILMGSEFQGRDKSSLGSAVLSNTVMSLLREDFDLVYCYI